MNVLSQLLIVWPPTLLNATSVGGFLDTLQGFCIVSGLCVALVSVGVEWITKS